MAPVPWKRILLGLLAVVLLVVAVGAAIALPRLAAIRTLLGFQDVVPAHDAHPAHFELLEGQHALGFHRTWLARPEGDGPFPLMVFVHGVSLKGIRDGRILRAVEAFRRGGFVVVAPEVPQLMDVAQPDRDSERLNELLHGVAKGQIAGTDPRRIGLVGISVGASVAVHACCTFRAEGGRGLRAICAIGAPADFARIAPDWFSQPPNPDDAVHDFAWYRRNVAEFCRNQLWRCAVGPWLGDNPDVERIIAWLRESQRPSGRPDGLETAEGAAFTDMVLGGQDVWRTTAPDVLQASWERTLRILSPAHWREKLRHLAGTAVFLLHGVYDPLVPVSEMEPLRDLLSAHTVCETLRSNMVAHTHVADAGLGEKLAHVVFMDDFFDMVGR